MELLFFGLIIGYFVFTFKSYDTDEFNRISSSPKVFEGDLANHEAGLLVALLAKVAKADGHVCELEAEVLKHTFDDISNSFLNHKEVRAKLVEIYKTEKETFENTIEVSQNLYNLTKHDYHKRLKVLEYLLNMAFIDKDFSKTEFMIVEDISNALQIKRADFENIVSQFEQFYASQASNQALSIENAYKILDCNSSDDIASVKKKYRKLVKQYHPDIIKGQGGDEHSIQEANVKLQEINEAYEAIKKKLKANG
jgi:DnaJ like chaperone protein